MREVGSVGGHRRKLLARGFVTLLFLLLYAGFLLFTEHGILATCSAAQRLATLPVGHLFEKQLTDFRLALASRLHARWVEVEPGVNIYLDPADYIPRTILIDGEWQPKVWEAIQTGLEPGGVFLDVGAHIGYFSLKAGMKVGPAGRVISFEPNPPIIEQLRANIGHSRAGNILVEPVALTAVEKTFTLYDPTEQGNSSAASLAMEHADQAGRGNLRSFAVPGRRLDGIVGELNLQRIDVVKIDVEGGEYDVLSGGIQSLTKFRPKLVIEISEDSDSKSSPPKESVTELLQRIGYDAGKRVDGGDWEFRFRETKDATPR